MVSEKRLSLTRNGLVRYQLPLRSRLRLVTSAALWLKTPYRDGTTHVFFEPLDFLARLAALVPRPRGNLTRFHGVFASNSKLQAQVTPARRGKGRPEEIAELQEKTPAEKHAAMTWAKRLKRVLLRAILRLFQIAPGDLVDIDVQICDACGGAVKIIAAVEDPVAIKKILDHLDFQGAMPRAYYPQRRALHRFRRWFRPCID